MPAFRTLTGPVFRMSPSLPMFAARWFAPGSRLRFVWQRLQHPYLIYLLIALVVWWPDGFKIGPVSDGWTDITNPEFVPDRFVVRYLQEVPHAIGIRLTPNSFVGWQWVLLAMTVSRGILMFELMKRLMPRQLFFALACGALVMFHPADNVYFWVDWTNVDVAWALAIAACLVAVLYLRSGNLLELVLLWLLQLWCCLTYTGFPPILLAFPVLAWGLQKSERRIAPLHRLSLSLVIVAFFIAFVMYEVMHGLGREGHEWNPHVLLILSGFWAELKLVFELPIDCLRGMPPIYAVYGLIPAAAMWLMCPRASAQTSDAHPGWRFYLRVCGVFVVLAVAGYLPYAVSSLRYGNTRQLLAAGFFIYAALLLPLFVVLSRRPRGLVVSRLFVALLAGYVTVVGLQTRAWNVAAYRSEESLLSAIATALPHPAPASSVFVKFDRNFNTRPLAGFYGREEMFIQALRLMYGDATLNGGFVDVSSPAPFDFHSDGLDIAQTGLWGKQPSRIPYRNLMLVSYRADGTAQILDRAWLQQQAPKGIDLSGYAPVTAADRPAPQAHICGLLERDRRPAYCE